jgi:cell division protein FtsN
MPARDVCRSSPPARAARATRKSDAGGTLLGLIIGIAVGLLLAAAAAYYVMKAGNPYQQAGPSKETVREGIRESGKIAKAEPNAPERPRFDFYKILPGIEEPKVPAKIAERPATDKATVERAASTEKSVAKQDERPPAEPPPRAPKPAERFWLQAGSFTAEADAETLKARLALDGWEAAVQAATLPDKGVRYRVRLGPYDNTDELNRMKGELGKRGFEVAVIKF